VEGNPEGGSDADLGSTDDGSDNGDGGRTTVIREIERTEERTVTRELTFTPEN
jgi:hypothetical protein